MDFHAGEIQVRFLNDRISAAEKHLSDLCQCLSSYARKTARTRDAADDVVKSLLRFGQAERLNSTLQSAVFGLADHLLALQDHRDAEVRRLEAKTVNRLAEYGAITKQAREDLRKGFDARSQEMSKRQQADRMRGRYPASWHQPPAASIARVGAVAEPSALTLEDKMDRFEQQKMGDVHTILKDFVNIELIFHAKAVELLTGAAQALATFDQEQDMQNFRNCLRAPILHQRMFRSTPDLSSADVSRDSVDFRHASLPSRRSLPKKASSLREDSDSELTDSEEDEAQELSLSPSRRSPHVKDMRRKPHSLGYLS